MTTTTGATWAGVKDGQELPPLEMTLTLKRAIMMAVYSRDLYPGHHDADFARNHGMPDIFLNVMSNQGILGRYVCDWAGPNAWLSRLKVAMVSPNCRGDTIEVRGSVKGKTEQDGKKTVDLDMQIFNKTRDRLTTKADASVELPE